MHISTIFYSGLEGLGGLEMQNEPVPQVRYAFSGWRMEAYTHQGNFQGFDGPVTFAGFTPDLDEFAIRIEDGPGNVYADEASRIGDAVGRTNFAGYRVEPGTIWQAKSEYATYYLIHSTLTSTPRVHHGSGLCSNGRNFGAIPLPGT